MEKRKLNTDEIEHIEHNYEVTITDNHPFTGGMRSNTVFIQTDKGPRAIKIYPENYSPKTADFQAKVSNHLHSEGIPAPKVFGNRGGNLITPYQKGCYGVMQHLPGKYPSQDHPKLVELTFGTLAKTLKSLSRYDTSQGIYEIPEVKTPLRTQLQTMQDFLRQRTSDADQDILDYEQRLCQIHEDYQSESARADFQRQLILGDFNLECLLVEGDELSGVLDFDQVHLYGRGHDFMEGFDNLFIDKQTPGLRLAERVNWDKLRESIAVYATQDPSIKDELDYFPLMHQNLGLKSIITTCNEDFRRELPTDYLRNIKHAYIRRLEIPTRLKQRFIDTLHQGYDRAA